MMRIPMARYNSSTGSTVGASCPRQTLDHLSGYRGSHPVRVGNGAAEQFQLDMYGALFDAVYLYNKHGAMISHELWTHLRQMVDWVCDHWQEADDGIWEVRGAVGSSSSTRR